MKENKADVNIEFSHIYTDQTLNKEQIVSAKIAKKLCQLLYDKSLTITTNVWIDDYNPDKVPELPESYAIDYLNELWRQTGISPHYYAFESNAVEAGKKLLETIPSSMLKWKNKGRNRKALYARFPDAKDNIKKIRVIDEYEREFEPVSCKYICPLLSAAYALAKVGAPLDIKPKLLHHEKDPPFAGKVSITILPIYDCHGNDNKKTEEKAKKLILASDVFSNYYSAIHYLFFDPDFPPDEKKLIEKLEKIGLIGDKNGK